MDGFHEDQERKSLLSCVELVQGLTYSPDHVRSHGTLVLRSSNIQDKELSLDDNVYVEQVYSDMDTLIGYRLEIISTFDLLSEDIKSTTLSARVWHGGENVTEGISAECFSWKRVSSDSTADGIWNAAHIGMKSFTLTVQDILYSATYMCELEES